MRAYVGAVSLAGAAVLAVQATRLPGALPSCFAMFALLVLLGELVPVRIERSGQSEEVVTSTTFTFAILLMCGGPVAVATRVAAAVLGAAVRRKPWWKAAFNAGQYALSVSAAALVLGPPSHRFEALDTVGVAAAGVVFFALNNGLTGVGLALAQRAPVLRYLRSDLGFQARTAAVLLALSPVVAIVAERSLVLVPLVALPVAVVYRGALGSRDRHEATHDPLTNLPNRRLFRDRVEQAVLGARRNRRPLAVMVIDLDRFKEVNDTLGHHIGDLLLQHVSSRLAAALREGDTIARLGGDEFAILLPHVTTRVAAARVADKLVAALEEPLALQGWTFDVQASIGVAVFPDHGEDVDSLLQRADVAMYLAKDARSGVELYTAERDRHSPRRLSLLGELRRAADDRQLLLHYQPKAELTGGAVHSVEALLRWDNPVHGLVPPDEFIPLAEHTGLIRSLTLYVLDEALRQCRTWHDGGLPVGVAVNLSVRNLYDAGFVDELTGLLARHAVEPSMLELEITESVVMSDPMRAIAVLRRLSDLGVSLSLDDFGVGYSSLAYLKRLPVGEIKIDRSFVRDLDRDPTDAGIVRSTIELARSLGLRVVAEGVETSGAWARLAGYGCDAAQGYYLCRPRPAAELTSWLVGRRLWVAGGARGERQGRCLASAESTAPFPASADAG